MRKWHWISGTMMVILISLAIRVYVFGYTEFTKTDLAIEQSRTLVRACEAYRIKNRAEGKYPSRLLDLVEPPNGRTAVIDGGKLALLDPWGEQYRYALVETKDGPIPHLWFEREIGGRLHLIGVKFVAGKVVQFGPPDR